MAGNETPSAPSTSAGEYGIVDALTGYVIESITDTSTPQREIVYDQFNRRVKEIRYDTLTSISLTVRGPAPAAAGTAATASAPISYTDLLLSSTHYIVDSIQRAGSYNGLKRWTVEAHKSSQCDTETVLATS